MKHVYVLIDRLLVDLGLKTTEGIIMSYVFQIRGVFTEKKNNMKDIKQCHWRLCSFILQHDYNEQVTCASTSSSPELCDHIKYNLLSANNRQSAWFVSNFKKNLWKIMI